MSESPRLHPWRELAVLALIGMELSWLALWFRIFTQSGLFISYWRAFAVLGGMWMGIYLFARMLALFRVRLSLQRGLLGSLLGAGLLVGLKILYFVDQPFNLKDLLMNPVRAFFDGQVVIAAELMVMLVVLWVWWRGLSLVQRQVGPSSTKSSFLAGILALSIYGLFAPLTGEIPAVALYLFLFFSLLAMSTARIYAIIYLNNARTASFDRKWLGGVLLSTSGLVALAAVVVALMQWGLADLIVFLVTWLGRLVFLIGMTLMIPVLLLLMAVVPALARFFQAPVLQAIQTINQFLQEVRMFATRLGLAIDLALEGFSVRLGIDVSFLKPVLLVGLILGTALVVLWSLGMLPRWSAQPGRDETEPLSGPGGLLRLLITARRGARALAAGVEQWFSLRPARRRLAAARIRRIYAALLVLSEKLGRPRPAGRTPLEYLPQLQELFADYAGELEKITGAYMRVRYGETPESFQEVQEIESAWRSIQAEGQTRLKRGTG